MKLYTFFNFTSIAAPEMHLLSHKTQQSFHRPRYCGVQTFPLKMHYGGDKLGKNWGRSGSDFGIAATEMHPLSHKTPQSFHRPRYCGVQTFPLKMYYGGEKLGKEWSDFDPQ